MIRLLPMFVLPYLLGACFLMAFYLTFFTPVGYSLRNTRAGLPVPENRFNFYMVLPAVLGFQNSSFFTSDARPRMLETFIKKYYPESPLLPYTYQLVETADKYNLHFALTASIAMQESHLCKRIPYESNNCWGLGIYGTKIWRFATYEEAIDAVGKTLSKYQSKGRVQPEEIMQLYTPGSDGTWARAVRHFMDEIQEIQ